MVHGEPTDLKARIEALVAEWNSAQPPEAAKLQLLAVPAGIRVLVLDGTTPKDVKRRGYDQLRVTFVGDNAGVGRLGRQLAMVGPWGFKEQAQAPGELPLLDEGGDRG